MSVITNLFSRVKIEPYLGMDYSRWYKMSYLWQYRPQKTVTWQGSTTPASFESKYPRKKILIVYIGGWSIIQHELLKSNLTITADTYGQQLQRVQEKLVLYSSIIKTQKKKWFDLPHPNYSSYLSTTYYHLFCDKSFITNLFNG